MPEDTKWMQVTEHWRSLSLEERRRRHLEAIPRHVANSMAMEGEPIDEAWIGNSSPYMRPALHHNIRRAS
ncbi:MAG: hypothetical protein TH68_10085 [Candidatus Synechococcus spongiarum 142]|uniref:Uncharacterized protein n=1 Tax=Candidatus Synechococcus spongiarum 142 TaxID=1608213 RepID=A0A6N3X6D8_9SYNE|nr:MAG: hypothetical protein TH68_10085 [Candidatus Synechococcus spongiarum 142]